MFDQRYHKFFEISTYQTLHRLHMRLMPSQGTPYAWRTREHSTVSANLQFRNLPQIQNVATQERMQKESNKKNKEVVITDLDR